MDKKKMTGAPKKSKVIRLLLVAPTEVDGLSGGQARAGRILSESLAEYDDIRFAHCIQPHKKSAKSIFQRILQRLSHYYCFLSMLGTVRPTVVHFFCNCSKPAIAERTILSLMAKSLGAKTLLNMRNDLTLLYCRSSPLTRFTLRLFLRCHTGVICQYSSLAEFFVNEIGFSKSKVFVAHNSINVKMKTLDLKSAYQRFNERRVLFLGSVRKRKRVEVLIEAASLCKTDLPLSLDIVGPAESESYLRAVKHTAADLGIADRCVFHGELFGEAKETVIKGAAILVLPSRAEGFANVALEAAQYGIPCILSRVGAAEDIKRSLGRGVTVVEVDDVTAVAEALCSFLKTWSCYRACAESVIMGVSDFSVQSMRDDMIAAYKAVIQ